MAFSVGLVIEFGAQKFWMVTTNGTTFYNGLIAAQNPIGSIGGVSFSCITGAVSPAYQNDGSGTNAQWTGDFGATIVLAYATLYATLQAAGYTTLP